LRVVLLGEDAPALDVAGVSVLAGEAVWSVSGAFRVDTIGADGPRHYQAKAVIAATGGLERIIPFPGWTEPGVVLLSDAKPLPGQRVLLAGCGPLLASAAERVRDAGGTVAAIVDLAAPARAFIGSVTRDGAGLRVAVRGADGAFDVDVVAVGYGMLPATEITRLMRAAHTYDAARGFWHPVLDEDRRSSIAGLYVADDERTGRLAGLAAARDSGVLFPEAHARLSAPLRGGTDSAESVDLTPLVAAIAPETIVCSCEDVSRATIDAAVAAGAVTLNQLKAWTRCGMGPCQGRLCADTAGALLQERGITRAASGQFTGRTPLRPVPLDLLTGTYDYADIVLPPSAPL
jgi:bacterioferritin-associated ferredoxin/pyruvate/2-oxoglutarate dehydrogenase complex dihydrolipoamide dehydrogenase (E3) component